MNLFVTGGSGYIGSVVVKRLLERGDQVTVFDNLERGHRCNLDSRAEFVEGDLRGGKLIAETLAKVFLLRRTRVAMFRRLPPRLRLLKLCL